MAACATKLTCTNTKENGVVVLQGLRTSNRNKLIRWVDGGGGWRRNRKLFVLCNMLKRKIIIHERKEGKRKRDNNMYPLMYSAESSLFRMISCVCWKVKTKPTGYRRYHTTSVLRRHLFHLVCAPVLVLL